MRRDRGRAPVLLQGSGLDATITAERHWGAETRTRTGAMPTTSELDRTWDEARPSAFRAEWRGFVVVPRMAWYTFAASADDTAT